MVRIGGLVSGNESDAKIIKCYHYGEISAKTEVYRESGYVGGICTGNLGEVSECYSFGNIITENIMVAGGIVGVNSNSVKNCYNSKTISTNGHYAGGMVGYGDPSSNLISNCYNVGNLDNGDDCAEIVCWTSGEVSGYYLNSSGHKGILDAHAKEYPNVIGKKEEEMKSQDFLDLLNNEEDVWKKDDIGINNGYPILSWQE